jgi:putative SOS response-associated peptidase YedK
MCGRFSILNDKTGLVRHFALTDAGEFITSYNITPSSHIPVIRLNDRKRELVNCHWGFIPHWAKDNKFKPINAKAETLVEKPFFRSAFRDRRCLIPASGFYEWKGQQGDKQPYYIKLPDTDFFAFAGLWDCWGKGDQTLESCAIITTTANDIMEPIHDRMPVILDPDQYDEWLTDGQNKLLLPYQGKIVCYPVSKKVNKPGNDGAGLIQPV